METTKHGAVPIQAMLSARARRMLEENHGYRRRHATCSREQLEVTLRAHDAPVYESVLQLEETMGGLQCGTLVLGARSALTDRSRTGAATAVGSRGEVLVLVGRADKLFYMDRAGAIFECVRRGDLQPCADSACTHVEKIAMLHEASRPRGHVEVELRARIGKEVAGAIGAVPVPEATDSVQSWWCAEKVAIMDGDRQDPSAIAVTIFGRTVTAAVGCLRAVADLCADIAVRVRAPMLKTEVYAPDVAPAVPSEATWANDTPVRRFSLYPDEGTLWMLGEGDRARFEQIAVWKGRVLEWESVRSGGARRELYTGVTVGSMPSLLPAAQAAIASAQGRRDPRNTCSRAELSAALRANGLPVFV